MNQTRIWSVWLDRLTATMLIITSVAMLWIIFGPSRKSGDEAYGGSKTERPPVAIPTEAVPFDGAVVRGSETAGIGIMEFTDFQCPYCGRFATETMPSIIEKYVEPGLVRFAFRNLPLERIHPHALPAAEAAECASNHGLFWEVHDALFKYPLANEQGSVRKRVLGAGMPAAELDRCLGAGAAAQRVNDDMRLARSLGLKSTPSFLLGTVSANRLQVVEIILGARPEAEFGRAIDLILSQSRPSAASK